MSTEHTLRIATFVLLVAGVAVPLRAQDDRLAAIDRYVAQARRDWKAPAIAVSIVKDDQVVFAKGYGVLEVGGNAATNEHTLFAIGSSTKAFTTASLGMLIDEGKLDWNDRVTEHLPWLQVKDPWVTRELRVRDLVTHRIGIQRADQMWGGTDWDRNEILRRQRFVEPIASFRSAWGYNNNMFLAAGQIIPELTGMSWDDFVKTRIFEPLGMKRSRTSTDPLPSMDNVAEAHTTIDGTVTAIPKRDLDNVGPAGSIYSSVAEMANWLRLQLGHGTFEGRQLLSVDVLEEMHTPQTIIPMTEWLSSTSPVNHQMVPESHFFLYGMGWFLQDYRGKKLVHHGGSIDGMRALIGMVPEENLGVAILTNLNPSSIDEALMFSIFDHYLGGPERDWSKEMLAGVTVLREKATMARRDRESARAESTSPSLSIEEYVGAYADSAYGTAEVTLVGKRLRFELGINAGDMSHWHYDTFKVGWDGANRGESTVTFALGPDGKVSQMTLGGLVMRRVGGWPE